jgi:large subunit ribosomal protein L25
MEKVVFKANRRDVVGKQVRALRRQGLLPAVIYGARITPINITLDAHSAGQMLPRVSSSQLILLDVNGDQHNVLVRERQRNPVTDVLVHVDFQAVSMTEKLRINVPLEFTGEAPAVRDFDGIVTPARETVEVECLPGDLPSVIEVDLSGLKEIGDVMYVRDLQLPPRVIAMDDPEEVVVSITAPISEAELAEAEATGAEEPEVIEKGKKEEEEF